MDASDAAPRRSKRDHLPSAKAAASELISPAPPSCSRRSQRRRVPPSVPPVPPSLSTGTSSVLCPVSMSLNDAIVANGQSRKLRKDVYTASTPSVYQQGVHSTYPSGAHRKGKVLGRYSSRDCAVLCEVILSQLEKQTLALTVLDEPKSPACIRWEAVAETMRTTHGVWSSPQECQIVWKFLAYGQHLEFKAGKELLPDSDEEEYDQSPKQINARLAASRAKPAGLKLGGGGAAIKYSTTVGKQNITVGEGVTGMRSDGRPLNDITEARPMKSIPSETSAQQTTKSASVRLYPTYLLPTGIPDAWHRPFGPKDALPLTFVASRFLRRKPTPPPAPSRVQQLTILPSPSASTGTAELKRKQADDDAEAAKKAKLVP